jgi:hypothetical protein
MDPGDGSGRHANNVKRAAKKAEKKKNNSDNTEPTKGETENGPND